MRKFVLKALLFVSIIVGGFLYLSRSYNKLYDIKSDYIATIIDKHKRLESFDTNRLLLVGCSNLAFGIDTKQMEDSLKLHVINLGIHAGLGFEFIMHEALSVVKKGDIIVLNIEYSLYDDAHNPRLSLINHAQMLYPPSKAYYVFDPKEKLELMHQNFERCFYKQTLNLDTVYNRKNFDRYGDEVAHLSKKPHKHLTNGGYLSDRQLVRIGKNFELFEQLQHKCDSLHAKLFLTFPSYARFAFNRNKEDITNIHQQLKTQAPYLTILAKPETFVFDDSLFFDTVYHLTRQGRDIRTKTLIEILKHALHPKNP